jgi:hypothetical protein
MGEMGIITIRFHSAFSSEDTAAISTGVPKDTISTYTLEYVSAKISICA